MDLEERVQVLEKEIEILKAQIQATLLEIQEQLLAGTHPSLQPDPNSSATQTTQRLSQETMAAAQQAHTQAPAKPEETPAPIPAPVPAIPPPVQPRAHRAEQETQVARPPDGRAKSAAKRPPRSPKPARPQHQEAPPTPRQQKQAAAEQPGRHWDMTETQPIPAPELIEQHFTRMQRLERWTQRKLREIGPLETRAMLDHYAESGQIDAETYENLVQFVMLYETQPRRPDFPPQPPQAEPAPAPEQQATAAAEAKKDEKNNMVLRLIAGIYNAGIGTNKE